MHSNGDFLKTEAQSSTGPAQEWVKALSDPDFHCEAMIQGAPGRLRIPERWRVSMTLPQFHIMHFPLEGRFKARVGEQEFHVAKGNLLWVPAGTKFHFWLPPGERLFSTRFRLRPHREVPWPRDAEPYALYTDAEACRPWFEGVVAEAGLTGGEPYHAQRERALLLCLFTELARMEGAAAGKSVEGLNHMQREAVRHYLAERAPQARQHGWPVPADLARHLRLSPDYFTRLFTKSYGMPPRRWLLEQRIRLAAIRLEESRLNVTEVATEFGYESVFLFSRQFKAVLGQSPTYFREGL